VAAQQNFVSQNRRRHHDTGFADPPIIFIEADGAQFSRDVTSV
jgi:hypothetical protein